MISISSTKKWNGLASRILLSTLIPTNCCSPLGLSSRASRRHRLLHLSRLKVPHQVRNYIPSKLEIQIFPLKMRPRFPSSPTRTWLHWSQITAKLDFTPEICRCHLPATQKDQQYWVTSTKVRTYCFLDNRLKAETCNQSHVSYRAIKTTYSTQINRGLSSLASYLSTTTGSRSLPHPRILWA